MVPYVATLVPTPPSFKVNHTKPTTSILGGIGKEKTFVVRNYKHMDEGVEEGGPIEKESHDKEVTWLIRMEHMEDLDAFDFSMTREMHPKDVSPMQEQEIDCDNPFYVPIPNHLMGVTQVLECIASDFDGTIGGRK